MASYAVWSSQTFGVQSEGGVPNSSPLEPRSNLQERRGFDPWAPLALRSATLRAVRRGGNQRSVVRFDLQKRLHSRRGKQKFYVLKPLVRALIVRFNFWREILRWLVDLKKTELPLGPSILDAQRGAQVSFHRRHRVCRGRPPLNGGAVRCAHYFSSHFAF